MFCWTNTSLVEPRSAASRIVGVLRSSEPFDDATVEGRSEEHTSELQSRSDLVCRLLLEKKKADVRSLVTISYRMPAFASNDVTWSDETYRIFGLVPGQDTIDFNGIQALIHTADRQMMAQAAAEAAHGGRRYDVEYRVTRPNGEERIVHSQGDVTRDESGRPLRVFGILQDITEQKRAEAEVRDSEARYRYIFQSTGVSIWEEDFTRVKGAIDELKD